MKPDKFLLQPRPGRLSDVFGIRIGSYEETESLNEISRKSFKGKKIELNYKGKVYYTESARFDIIESRRSRNYWKY